MNNIRWAILSLVVMTVCAHLACVPRHHLKEEDVFTKIRTCPNSAFANMKFYHEIIACGIPALPHAMARLRLLPEEPWDGEDGYMPPRICLQSVVKQILRADYLEFHSERSTVSWVEVDHTEELLRWWEKQDGNVRAGGLYPLPDCME